MNFKDPYLWMSKQLSKKIPPPENVKYPIWIWKQWLNNKRKRPDLRANCLLPKNTFGARLELEIPEYELLLSDFDGWHSVLNNHYYCNSDKDYEWFEKISHQITFEELNKIKVTSWMEIFNIENFSDSTQGVVWEIKKEYIQDISYFQAR